VDNLYAAKTMGALFAAASPSEFDSLNNAFERSLERGFPCCLAEFVHWL
jgi:hypothetical protein